jgi:acetylornithine deacetylase/succinyl-diaminopimelate desuccinylase-like protein
MDYEITKKLIDADFEKEVLPNLSEYIKIDNLSPFYDPEWNTNGKQDNAAKFCLDWVLRQNIKGLKGEIIKEADKTPLIFIEIDAHGSDKNYLLYGHFDKQPHFTGWAEGLGPCTPVIKNGFLYGRGGADDGYAIFSSIVAIKAVQTQGGKHGRVVIIIEGSEESGSPHLIPYIEGLKDRIGKPDLMICLDSGSQDYDRLWVTTSLRGVCMADVTVEVLAEGVHSGAGTGYAADSFMILRNLLDRIEDSKSGKIIDAFQVEIPKSRVEEATKVADLKGDHVLENVKLLPGVKGLTDNNAELILNNTWRASLAVVGASGLPDHKLAGNVLRPSTTVRISMRLPPSYDGEKAAPLLKDILTKDVPYNAKVTVELRKPGSGWNNKDLSEKLTNSLNVSSKKIWGKELLSFGEGGSIPFIKQLADAFPACELLVIGVLGPNSNAHSCNEALHIDYCKGITVTVAHTLNDYA